MVRCLFQYVDADDASTYLYSVVERIRIDALDGSLEETTSVVVLVGKLLSFQCADHVILRSDKHLGRHLVFNNHRLSTRAKEPCPNRRTHDNLHNGSECSSHELMERLQDHRSLMSMVSTSDPNPTYPETFDHLKRTYTWTTSKTTVWVSC
jgi:hypothetical protein